MSDHGQRARDSRHCVQLPIPPGPSPALAPAPAPADTAVVVADGAVVSAPRCCCSRQSIARSDQAADCSRRGWDQ